MIQLGVDFGEKRTGLAVGDEATGIATPLRVIDCGDADRLVAEVAAEALRQSVDHVVVGLPLNMDGSRGPAAKRVEKLAQKLRARTEVPVRLIDERLSSFEAEGQLTGRGLTRKKKKARRDALAAATILRTYWSNKSSNP